jgi:glucose/arabinose dehydrogenase
MATRGVHGVAGSIALILVGAGLSMCDNGVGGGGDPVEGEPGSSEQTPAITAAPEIELPDSAVQTIATGLRIPWGVAFLPDGTALVTERGNQVPTFDGDEDVDASGVARILSVSPDGTVTEVQRLPEVDLRLGEGGLLGIAVSPDYDDDGWVFVYYSTTEDNRIARLQLGGPPEPLLTGLPV